MATKDSLTIKAALELSRAGWPADHVALVLDLSPRTVKRYRARLREVKAEVEAFRLEFDHD